MQELIIKDLTPAYGGTFIARISGVLADLNSNCSSSGVPDAIGKRCNVKKARCKDYLEYMFCGMMGYRLSLYRRVLNVIITLSQYEKC